VVTACVRGHLLTANARLRCAACRAIRAVERACAYHKELVDVLTTHILTIVHKCAACPLPARCPAGLALCRASDGSRLGTASRGRQCVMQVRTPAKHCPHMRIALLHPVACPGLHLTRYQQGQNRVPPSARVPARSARGAERGMALEVLRWGAPERLLRAGLLQSLRPRLPELLGSVDEGVRASALALLAALLPHVSSADAGRARWRCRPASCRLVPSSCAGAQCWALHRAAPVCSCAPDKALQVVTGMALT